jgi:hypothetical protein
VARVAVEPGNASNPASIVFVGGVVEACRARCAQRPVRDRRDGHRKQSTAGGVSSAAQRPTAAPPTGAVRPLYRFVTGAKIAAGCVGSVSVAGAAGSTWKLADSSR